MSVEIQRAGSGDVSGYDDLDTSFQQEISDRFDSGGGSGPGDEESPRRDDDAGDDEYPRQTDDADDEELPRQGGDKKDGPGSKTVKERDRYLPLRMACIDNQCMICGWPFQWSGGDRTHLGATLYSIEQLYVSLKNNSYERLFSDYEKSHILHKHSRTILGKSYMCSTNLNDLVAMRKFLKGFVSKYPLLPRLTEDISSTHAIMVQETWAARNTAVLIENITSQVAYTFDSALATFTALAEDTDTVDAASRHTYGFARVWLEKKLQALSHSSKLRDLVVHYDTLTHSACKDCNKSQTMEFMWNTAVLAVLGIRKAHVPPSSKTATQRNDLSEVTATVLMLYIVRAVYLKLESRYTFLNETNLLDFRVVQVFIQQLFFLNMQTATACLQDASAIDPQPRKKEGPTPTAISLRHRFKAYAAFSACAVQHACIKMSLSIAGAVTLPVGVRGASGVTKLLDPLLGVCLAMDIDQFWKYVVVECAEYGFAATPENPRPVRQTVCEFYFGPDDMMRFKVTGAVDAFHDQFHGLFTKSIHGITNGMISAMGIAMHMFALSNTTQIGDALYERRLRLYPVHLHTIGQMLVKRQEKSNIPGFRWKKCTGLYSDYSLGEHVLINPIYGQNRVKLEHAAPPVTELHDEIIAILRQMRVYLLSHTEAVKDVEVITSSTLLGRTSPPGLWCKLMRAKTHKKAVEKMLRMPLLFNEMVSYSLRTYVLHLIRKLLATPDPLSDTV